VCQGWLTHPSSEGWVRCGVGLAKCATNDRLLVHQRQVGAAVLLTLRVALLTPLNSSVPSGAAHSAPPWRLPSCITSVVPYGPGVSG
jgi:hypothetical protein